MFNHLFRTFLKLVRRVGRTRIGTQAALAVGSIFLVSCVGIGLISLRVLEAQLDSVVASEQDVIVSQIADGVSQRIQTIRRALQVSAKSVRPDDFGSAEKAQAFLNANHGLAALFDRSVFIFSADGTLMAERPFRPDRIGQNGSWRPYIKETLESRKPVISEPFTTNAGDANVVVVITMPVVTEEGVLLGMMSGSLGLTRPDVLGPIEKIVIGRTGSVAITTTDGKVIIGKNKDRLSKPLYPVGANALFARALEGFEGTDASFSDDGRPAYVSYKKVAETGWLIRAVYPKDEAKELVTGHFRELLWVLAGLTVCVLAVVLVIVRYLTKPLTLLSQHIAGYSGAQGLIAPMNLNRGAVEVRSLTVAFNDMTRQLNAREELVINAMRQHQIITENSTDLITRLSLSGVVLYASPAIELVLKISREEFEGKNILDFVHAEDRAQLGQSLVDAASADESNTVSFRAMLPGNQFVWLESAQRRLINGEAHCEILSVSRNIESHIRMQEELYRQARVDHLTELPNRLALEEQLTILVAKAYREGNSIAVLVVDIDRFKNINDTLGHRRGDEVIGLVANRFSACARPSDTIARMGGDEFVVLVPGIKSIKTVQEIAQRYMECLKGAVLVDGVAFHITASVGISYSDDGSVAAETMLSNADVAMYRAKGRGGNAWVVFESDMSAGAYDRLSMENALFGAVERNELRLHYQPLISAKSGKIVGVEALVRWQHPEYGMVPPVAFIAIAERVGLIEGIGEWVLVTACNQMAQWQKSGMSGWTLSVNLSARQFASEHFPETVKRVLSESTLAPQCLELELTETVLMEDPARSQKMLVELKSCGVTIALDDFGIGYSSMSYLMSFTLDTLKIDKAFTKEILTSEKSKAIVQATFDIARALNLKTVAEGVEEHSQASFLAELGCDLLQGYYFAKPMPADDLYRFAMTAPVHLLPRSANPATEPGSKPALGLSSPGAEAHLD